MQISLVLLMFLSFDLSTITLSLQFIWCDLGGWWLDPARARPIWSTPPIKCFPITYLVTMRDNSDESLLNPATRGNFFDPRNDEFYLFFIPKSIPATGENFIFPPRKHVPQPDLFNSYPRKGNLLMFTPGFTLSSTVFEPKDSRVFGVGGEQSTICSCWIQL